MIDDVNIGLLNGLGSIKTHLKFAAEEGTGLKMALSITHGSPKTRVPQEPSQEHIRRTPQTLLSLVTVASSATKSRPKLLEFSNMMHPPMRLRRSISNLIIHHYVLARALCRNPDF